jgi:hypothetical protein
MPALNKESYINFLKQTNPNSLENETFASPYTWPEPVFSTITIHSKLTAAKKCSLQNLNKKRNDLSTGAMEGSIPEFISLKFKKLYNQEHEAPFKAAMIQQAMKSESEATRLKIVTLTNEINNAATTLHDKLKPIITNVLIKQIEPNCLKLVLEYGVREFQAQFNFKMAKDKEAKELKAIKFQLEKEKATAPALISTREHKNMLNQIKQLEKKLKSATIQSKSKKPNSDFKKGGLAGQPKSPQKTKEKNKRKEDGKQQNTSKSKRSRGKNGN